MMINVMLITKQGTALLNFDKLTSIDYREASGQLYFTFTGEGMDRCFNLKLGTTAKEVWERIHMALATLYDARSMHILAVKTTLDLTPLQDDEVPF